MNYNQLQVGHIYNWLPSKMQSLDGKTYDVYTLYASGRGWSAKRYHTPKVAPKTPFQVLVLPENDWYPGSVRIKFVRGYRTVMLDFARRPYVRKDGTFNVVSEDCLTDRRRGFAGAYGFHRLEDYHWERGSSDYLECFQDLIDAGYLARGENAVIGNIHVGRSQLVFVK